MNILAQPKESPTPEPKAPPLPTKVPEPEPIEDPGPGEETCPPDRVCPFQPTTKPEDAAHWPNRLVAELCCSMGVEK